jgi:hypothetical protein
LNALAELPNRITIREFPINPAPAATGALFMDLEQGNYDLLRNPVNFAWAVNCLVEEDSVHIGALYLEPQIPDPNIRLAYNERYVDVIIPEEYIKRTESLRAWNVELPIATATQLS